MGFYAGIDLGGTKILALITDKKGKIFGRAKVKTKPGNPGIDQRIVNCYESALLEANLKSVSIISIGLAVPSSVDPSKGILKFSPNLGLHNVPLAGQIRRKTGKPVFMDNDANMGVYAEHRMGSAKDFDDVYGIFIGTGIGGGYIHDGKLIRGKNFTAGEVGHIIVKKGAAPCPCGRNGCLEAIAGKLGILRTIRRQVEEKKKKTILEKYDPEWREGVGAAVLRKCFEKNDKVVRYAVLRSAKYTGIAIANIINLTGIGAIVLGGGVIEEMGEWMLPVIRKNMETYALAGGAKGVKLLRARLGDDAVALGAALHAAHETDYPPLKK